MLRKFELRDLLLIAIMASLSIATKPMVKSLSALAVGSWGMPNGLVGGVIYMMWLSLIYRLVGKTMTVVLFSVIQGILAIGVLGMPPMGIASYLASGIAAEMVFLMLRQMPEMMGNIAAGGVANVAGALVNYYLFFGKVTDPLPILIGLSLVSGGMSGILTRLLAGRLKRIWRRPATQ